MRPGWRQRRRQRAAESEDRAYAAGLALHADARSSVIREHSPALRPDSALAQLVRETRESGVHVEAWTVRGGHIP